MSTARWFAVVLFSVSLCSAVAGCNKGGGDEEGGGGEGGAATYESFNTGDYEDQDSCSLATSEITSERGQCMAQCDCIHDHPMGSAATDPGQNDMLRDTCHQGCETMPE